MPALDSCCGSSGTSKPFGSGDEGESDFDLGGSTEGHNEGRFIEKVQEALRDEGKSRLSRGSAVPAGS